MANHKNRKPRKSRSGCHMCKPWKVQGNSKQAKHIQELKAPNE